MKNEATETIENILDTVTKIDPSDTIEVVKTAQKIMEIDLNLIQTLGLSVVVLLIGRYLVRKIGILNKFCIPEPVVGGLLFAFITLAGHQTGTFEIKLDPALKDFFMVAFFTTVGFGASLPILKKGGVAVLIFLGVVSVMVILQNIVGVSIAVAFGEKPLLGLLTGSISMTGGHGTAAAFAPEIYKNYGLAEANTVAIASATFGLIAGGLIGGPVAKRLIEKHNLRPSGEDETNMTAGENILSKEATPLSSVHLSNAFFQISIAVGIGSIVSVLIAKTGLTVPSYIGAMLIAAAMRNILKDGTKFQIRIKEVQSLGSIFLAIFLAQALMNLKLWELASLALPLAAILIAQAVLMFIYATFITFNIMGKDYDAAVLSAGHCGFGMGATPNAVANMTAIVNKYFPSPKAFFVLPIVGGLFIDFVNALIITACMNIVGKPYLITSMLNM